MTGWRKLIGLSVTLGIIAMLALVGASEGMAWVVVSAFGIFAGGNGLEHLAGALGGRKAGGGE